MVQKLWRINERDIEEHCSARDTEVYWGRSEKVIMGQDVSKPSHSGGRLHHVDDHYWRIPLKFRWEWHFGVVWDQCHTIELTRGDDKNRSLIFGSKNFRCINNSRCSFQRHHLKSAKLLIYSHDFKWLQQLRFYNQSENVLARQVQSELYYGYEYLGATTRLVITPLTDRCWIYNHRSLAYQTWSQPCWTCRHRKNWVLQRFSKVVGSILHSLQLQWSNQCNHDVETFFRPSLYRFVDLFSTNSIESILKSCLSFHNKSWQSEKHFCWGNIINKLILGGKTIHLNHDLGIFITMNPGYAGRTELPDNLKTLFRPVSMMVPDYTLIAEIMLFSEGFASAKELSKKMTKLYKLSSEQLSKQDHYDFGMRAVKSVLVMAGGLK